MWEERCGRRGEGINRRVGFFITIQTLKLCSWALCGVEALSASLTTAH